MRAKVKLREDVCIKRMSLNVALQPWLDKTGMPGDFERVD
jgi:hypothetical protein